MSSEQALHPTGWALIRRGLEGPTSNVSSTRLRPGNLDEPPYADPLVGWCGAGGERPPATRIGDLHCFGQPIVFSGCFSLKLFFYIPLDFPFSYMKGKLCG